MPLTKEQYNFIKSKSAAYNDLTRAKDLWGRTALEISIVEEWLAEFGNTASDGDTGTLSDVGGWTWLQFRLLICLGDSMVPGG